MDQTLPSSARRTRTYHDNIPGQQEHHTTSRERKTSSGKWTKHLNIRYFFVTDKIKKGEVKVAYCPMQEMLGDFFTKPLQGAQFVRMRSKILTLPSSSITAVHRSVLENVENVENVENDKNKSGSAKITRSSTRLENTRLKKIKLSLEAEMGIRNYEVDLRED